MIKQIILGALLGLFLVGCASESHRVVETQKVRSFRSEYHGPKHRLAVGLFGNQSGYGQGMFASGNDRLSSQAKVILTTHLQQTNRFYILDRNNMNELSTESKYSDKKQKIVGANIVLTGSVTEFGRKVVGDRQFFGIIGKGKRQVAYSKVMINVVDVETSTIIHSVQAASEYDLSNREVLGFGGTAGYDSTLNGKVLNLAIKDAVDRLVDDLENNVWKL